MLVLDRGVPCREQRVPLDQPGHHAADGLDAYHYYYCHGY